MEGFRKYNIGYTARENERIVKFIISKKAHDRIKALSLYKEMEAENILPGRKAEAIRTHFRKMIITQIRKYCDEKNAKAFERVWNHKRVTSNKQKHLAIDLSDEEQEIVDIDEDDFLPDQLKKNAPVQKKINTYFATRSNKNQQESASQGSVRREGGNSSQQTRATARTQASQQEMQQSQPPMRRQASQQERQASQRPTRRQASQQVEDTDDVWLEAKPTRSQPSQRSPVRLVPFRVGAQRDILVAKSSLHLNDVPEFDTNTEKYSRTEDRSILEFLARKVSEPANLETDEFWQNISRWPPIPGRSWASVRKRFHELQKIRLDHLGLSFSVLMKLNLSAHAATQKFAVESLPKSQATSQRLQPIRTTNTQAAAARQYDVDEDSVLGALIEDSSLIGIRKQNTTTKATRFEQARRAMAFDDPLPSTSRDNYFRPLTPQRKSSQRSVTFDNSPPKSYKTFEKVPSGVAAHQQSQQQRLIEEEEPIDEPVCRTMVYACEETRSLVSECSAITNNLVSLYRNTKTIKIAAQAQPREPFQQISRRETQSSTTHTSQLRVKLSDTFRPIYPISSSMPRHEIMSKVLSADESDSDTEHQTRRNKKDKQMNKSQNKYKQVNMSQETIVESVVKSNLLTKHTQSRNVENSQDVVLISDDEATIAAPVFDSDSSDNRREAAVNKEDSDMEHLVYESDSISDAESDMKQQNLTQYSNVSVLNKSDNIHAISASKSSTQVNELLVYKTNRLNVESQDMDTQMTDSPEKDSLIHKKNDDKNSETTDSHEIEMISEINAQEDPPLSPLTEQRSPAPQVDITTKGALQIQNEEISNQQPQMPPPKVYVLPHGIQDPIKYLQDNAQTSGIVPNNFTYPVPNAGQSGVMQPTFNPQVIYMMPPPAIPKPQKIYIVQKSGKRRQIKKCVRPTAGWTVTTVSESSDEESPPVKKRQLEKKTKKKVKGKHIKSENNNNVSRTNKNSQKRTKIVPKKKSAEKKMNKMNKTPIKTKKTPNPSTNKASKVLTRHQKDALSKSQEQLTSDDESALISSDNEEEEDRNLFNFTQNLESQSKSNTSGSSGSKGKSKKSSTEDEPRSKNNTRRSVRKRRKQDLPTSIQLSESEEETQPGRFVTTRARKASVRTSHTSEGASELARLAMIGRRT